MPKRASTAPEPASKRQKLDGDPFVRFQIIAGSYERLLYGLRADYSQEKPPQLALTPFFSFPAHASCIKAVSASPPAIGSSKRWLVTGSTEDNVKVWDLRRRKEVGDLAIHEGSTTQIKFIDSKLLLTASTDSTINLLRTKDWAVLRTFKGHKGRVNDVDLHPKGRILLSVGQDRTLRFWDLFGNTGSVTGKGGSSSTKLGQEGDVVRWNTDGSAFGVICGRELRLYTTGMELKRVLDSKSRFHDVRFFQHPSHSDSDLLLLACDDGKCRIYTVSQLCAAPEDLDGPVCELVGHQNRIKQVSLITVSNGQKPTLHAVTASSDGFLHVYSLDELAPSLEPIARYDTKGSRLTCLSVAGYTDHLADEEPALADSGSDGSTSDDEDSTDSLDLPEAEGALSEDESDASGSELGDGSGGEWGGIDDGDD